MIAGTKVVEMTAAVAAAAEMRRVGHKTAVVGMLVVHMIEAAVGNFADSSPAVVLAVALQSQPSAWSPAGDHSWDHLAQREDHPLRDCLDLL